MKESLKVEGLLQIGLPRPVDGENVGVKKKSNVKQTNVMTMSENFYYQVSFPQYFWYPKTFAIVQLKLNSEMKCN